VSAVEQPPIRWKWVLSGLIFLAILVVSNLGSVIVVSNHVQFLLLCAGIVYVTWGFFEKLPPMERNALRLVGVITLIALFLRLIGLDGIIRFFIDEITFASAAETLLKENRALLTRFSDVIAFPYLYPYMESVAMGVFGRNLIGLRLVSAILGTLTIPAVYMLTRALFNKPTALAAALLLATYPPHLHLSRTGLNNIADPLFGTLALGWLAWGWKTGQRGYFALAGAALGLTQYFYDGGRLLYPPLIVAWLIGMALFLWLRGEEWRGRVIGTLSTLLIAVIIALPVYLIVLANGQSFSTRFSMESSIDGMLLPTLFTRTLDVFRLYVEYPETTYFYKGETPLLLTFMAAPFMIGVAYAFARALRFDSGGLLLIVWVLATSVGNALLAISLSSARYVVVFPSFMMLAAAGLYFALRLVRRHRVNELLMWCAITMAIGQVIYYFVFHVPLYNDESRIYEDSQDAAFRAADFQPYTFVHLVAEPYDYHKYSLDILEFMRDDVFMFVLAPSEFNAGYLETLSHEFDNAFFLLPSDTASLELLQEYFVVSEPQHSPYPLPPDREFLLYYAVRTINLPP
jgi:4-amino-4-deoxy-L-arabinose transferase-like glycosyltransferase